MQEPPNLFLGMDILIYTSQLGSLALPISLADILQYLTFWVSWLTQWPLCFSTSGGQVTPPSLRAREWNGEDFFIFPLVPLTLQPLQQENIKWHGIYDMQQNPVIVINGKLTFTFIKHLLFTIHYVGCFAESRQLYEYVLLLCLFYTWVNQVLEG